MTADAPAVVLEATPTTSGCTGCGTQATVILHPYHGRRCPTCISLPAGPFRADHDVDATDCLEHTPTFEGAPDAR